MCMPRLAYAVPGARLAAVVDSTPMRLDALKALYSGRAQRTTRLSSSVRDGGIDAALIATLHSCTFRNRG